MVKWKEKGWFKASGLHHGGAVLGAVVAVDLFGSIGAAVAGVLWYARKEIRESLVRKHGLYGVEWLDFN